ncbi:hypothetical protein HI031_03180 [Staphylococcus haemolyticus]|nr:hypothetical protein HI031_03180 [Staphylococcus haemolyticus]
MVSQFRNQLLELLYDLNDELKVNLIELNSAKQLFMISYYQGQKQAIEALQNIVASEENEEVLKRLLNDYAGQFANLSSNLVNLLNQQDVSQIDLSQAIDNYYHNLGQQTVITKVQNLI